MDRAEEQEQYDSFMRDVPKWSNCRLVREHERLNKALTVVEDEIEARMGKGGGGLK